MGAVKQALLDITDVAIQNKLDNDKSIHEYINSGKCLVIKPIPKYSDVFKHLIKEKLWVLMTWLDREIK